MAAKMVARPFDLERGPLLRAALMRLGEAHFVLLTVVHHIAFDGWSSSVLFREMHETYAALARRERPELAPLPLQYTDYAYWQRNMLLGARRERLTDFWREQLRGPLPVLALPADYPRPPTQTYRGKKHFIALDPMLMGRLEELGRSHGASLFMVLLTGYAALLGRYAAQEDVIVGCPVAGRERRELEPLIGFFVNLLPMRIDLRGDPTFVELLLQVRATVLAAYEHQALPFELIVDALQPPRDPRRHVIFQTILAFQNTMPLPCAPEGATVAPLEFPEGPARSDLDLYLWKTPEGLAGTLPLQHGAVRGTYGDPVCATLAVSAWSGCREPGGSARRISLGFPDGAAAIAEPHRRTNAAAQHEPIAMKVPAVLPPRAAFFRRPIRPREIPNSAGNHLSQYSPHSAGPRADRDGAVGGGPSTARVPPRRTAHTDRHRCQRASAVRR